MSSIVAQRLRFILFLNIQVMVCFSPGSLKYVLNRFRIGLIQLCFGFRVFSFAANNIQQANVNSSSGALGDDYDDDDDKSNLEAAPQYFFDRVESCVGVTLRPFFLP